MVRISSLAYPKKSHRKAVTLPKPSVELAEFFGIMMGDGGIGSAWQATITLNAVADKDYSAYVSELCFKLFDLRPAVSKRKTRDALVLRLSSATLVDFFLARGLCYGNKLAQGA